MGGIFPSSSGRIFSSHFFVASVRYKKRAHFPVPSFSPLSLIYRFELNHWANPANVFFLSPFYNNYNTFSSFRASLKMKKLTISSSQNAAPFYFPGNNSQLHMRPQIQDSQLHFARYPQLLQLHLPRKFRSRA